MTDGADGLTAAVRRRDDVADRQVLLRSTGLIALGYGIGASVQSAWIYSQLVPEWAQVELWRRLAANGAAVAALVVALGVLHVHRSRGAAVVLRLVMAALLMALLRVGVQVLLGVHAADDLRTVVAECVTGLFVGVIAGGIGLWGMTSRRRARASTRAAEREAVSVELAVRALEDEEVRVRRTVAEGLHGTLQQRLVLVEGRLEAVAEGVADLPGVAADVAWAREQLAVARDVDVRRMSRLLYPERVEMGLVPAVRALLIRMPTTIATVLDVGDALRELDDPAQLGLTTGERLLAVRVVEEAVTNALKHGPPTRIEVGIDVVDGALVVVVTNDGEPYVPPAEPDPQSGTARLEQRLRLVGGTLRVARGERAGTVVEAVVPLGVETDDERVR